MNKIFRPFWDKFVVVFIDAILIYSKIFEEHEESLRKVLEIFKRKKIVCQPIKVRILDGRSELFGACCIA